MPYFGGTRRALFGGQRTTLLSNLVAYWKMDEASGTRNDSHGANHLTDNNTVTSAAAKLGTASAQFTASNLEYLSLADNAAMSIGGHIDFCTWGWVWMDSKSATRTIMVKGTANTTAGLEYRLYYDVGSDRIVWGVGNGTIFGNATASNFGAPSTGQWIFFYCWHDAIGDVVGIKINNGTADTQAHNVGVQDTGGNLRFGSRADAATLVWDGRIDGVGFCKGYLLTTAEQAQMYNSGTGLDYPFT
jgi:hypothetical protein